MNVLTVKISAQLERDLDIAAATSGSTKSDVARKAIAQFVAQPAVGGHRFISAYELAGDLVGTIARSPRGLATNRKYMHGFGKE
jgi:hypothetical protein